MSYSIQTVDIKDPWVEQQLIDLLKDAFGAEKPIPHGHLYKNTVTKMASGPTIFLAAIEEGKIIGCNGFMATDFIYNGKTLVSYQSCWSATHPKHQGRKIFVNIINEAKNILKAKGAGFIYGVPNNNSYPIFTKKLGFKEIPPVMVKIPNLPFLKSQYFKSHDTSITEYIENSFLPIEEQIVDLKRNISNREVLEIREGLSFIWGKIKTKEIKFGIKLRYFYLGGMELNDPGDYKTLIQKIFSIYKVNYIQIVSSKTNLYNRLLKHWKPALINSFIFYELNSTVDHINLFYGSIDVF